MPPRIVAIFILALLSAGCLSAPSDPASTGSLKNDSQKAIALPNPNATALVPSWKVGDAWSISTSGGGSGSGEHSVLVVTSASSDGYTMSTTSAAIATFDALFDVSYVGKIRASDLAGAQADVPVRFFDFPLVDGKAWSTRWDNKTMNLTAKAGPSGSFAVVAMDGDKTYAAYDYQPALKWWSHLDFASGFVLKVDRFSENWTGEYRVATAKLLLESSTAIPVATLNTYPFTVDPAQTSVILSFHGGSSAYARAFAIQDPSNAPYQPNATPTDAQPTGGAFVMQETLPPTPGTWHIEAPVGHTQGGGFLLTVHEIRMDLRRV